MNRKSINFITRTGILLALALIFQIYFRSFAQPVVGPMVNFVLVFSAMLVGASSGIIIGALTPLIAFMFGIMPLFPVVPFIMVGNALLVAVFSYIQSKKIPYSDILAVIVGAFTKFAFLAFSIRYLVNFFVPQVPPPMIQAMTLPQLYTALIGGGLAVTIARAVAVAMKKQTMAG